MAPQYLFKAFKILFPALVDEVQCYRKIHGDGNSIRLVRHDGHDMIFTYNKYGDWRLEDARSFRKK